MKLRIPTSLPVLLLFSVLIEFAFAPVAMAQEQTEGSCVCDCVYLRNANIKNHSYYYPGAGNSCQAIEGKACIGQLRGEQYRGRVQNCDAAPTRASTPLDGWQHIRQVNVASQVQKLLLR